MKYLVTVKTIKGNTVNYIYEGHGEYLGEFESVEDRIKRHFEGKRNVLSYEVKSV